MRPMGNWRNWRFPWVHWPLICHFHLAAESTAPFPAESGGVPDYPDHVEWLNRAVIQLIGIEIGLIGGEDCVGVDSEVVETGMCW